MKAIRKILYATDFSESSAPACAYAQTLALLAGAEVHVLHVIGELADNRRSRIPPEAFALFEKEIEIQVVKEMEEFCRRHLGEQVSYTTESTIGTPYQAILAAAKEHNADLIVMGTHGRTGLEHVLVGSTAERVVRRSPVPVLTVRAQP
ncbi:universal stress protein [Geoalkalibacter halelectricus]|uniref:Universal stress protein n=1 Tax=Geoalkalibacter halelectricus TaxID=2847045 RepID=A0ABY5ZKX5_9BACT|nr:universal stress protein [Geoalkalibacter halelectricus]MDO3377052.1 universal stress protein [Geoalkalibacter halelectricus]UWZ79494.1 universal stress protein [Geoalkalibacter halelectricus]